MIFAPSKSELKVSIPNAIQNRIKEITAAHASEPEWKQRLQSQHDESMRLAREGWVRWKPTELLDLAKAGPARRARNDASLALRELESEGVVETFEYEGAGRVYAVRLRPNGEATS